MSTVSAFPESASALFNASPLPTFVIDPDTLRLLAANRAAEERYGYSREQFVGMRVTELHDPDGVARQIERHEFANGEALVAELQRHQREDGTVFPAHCATRECTLSDTRVFIMVVTELTEMRPLDAEQRFVEKMEALTRLGGGVAHEFNNLMTAILATTDLALASPHILTSVRDDLQSIRAAGQRAAGITRQLLAFSGSQSISLRQTDVNLLLRQLEPLIRHVLPANVSLRLDLRADGAIEVDPARMEQVILNLVLNAVEAMPQGGKVTVSTTDVQDYVSVVVEDTGPGMDETTLRRIFEPFHSTKGPGGGRGLGLASVYGTVKQMGGSTDIESAAGKGTRVRMVFDRAIVQVELDELELASAPVEPDATGGEVVLIVEDEPGVRAPLSRMLRNKGYYVLEADNGEDALRVMQEHHEPIHLVITDVMMPEMDGTQLVSLLRAWYPRMRVLFISGYSPQYLEAQGGTAVRGGAFLAKPFALDDFARRVRQLLDEEWTGGADASS